MTWFRVDDKLHDHRKARALGVHRNAALGLWLLAGSWSADNLTDGFICRQVVARFDPKERHARRLVEVGLWVEATRDGEHGYQFHEWHEHQPSRADVQKRRAETRDRVKQWRERKAQDQPTEAASNLNGNAPGNALGNALRTPLVTPPPTRPDPTRPDLTTSTCVGMPANVEQRTREAEADPPPLAILDRPAGKPAGRTERPSPADLNATATRRGGFAIVGAWAQGNPGITTTQRRKLAKAVDDLIAAQGDPALMPAALDEVHRPGWRDPIKALPHAYDRVRRDRNPAPPAPPRTAPRESTTDRAVAEVHNVFAALRAEHAFQENPAQTALIEGTA